MNFKFCYFKFPDSESLTPTIYTSGSDNDNENLISLYFVDDGGAPLESYIEYLTECLKYLKNTSIYNADISSNSYGVEIYNNNVKIFFLYSEDEEIIVDRFKLAEVLNAWILFLKREPEEGYEEIVNID